MGTVIKNTQQDGWDDSDLPVVDPSASVNIDPINFRDEIAAHESKGMGDYQATNNDSTAKGRYQFLWSQYGDQIRKTTGVKNAQEFLNNPQAQDQFMDKYTQNDVIPWVKKMKDAGETRGLSDKQLGQLYHFVGQPGAEHYLQTGKYIVPGHNTSIDDYTTERVPVSQSASTWEDDDLPVVDGQKKSPDVSATTSDKSSQNGQSGVSQNNPQQPFVWNGATPNLNPQPVSAQDAIIQTAQAKQAQIDQNAAVMNGNSMTDKNNNAAIAIHTDLADAINKGQLAPSNNDVAATLNAASDPHGDPAYNGQVMQQRISTLESQKQQALLNKDQAGADKIDVQLAQLRTAYDHIRGLQQANAIYQQQKTQEQAQLVATPQPQEATTDVNSFNPSAPVAVTENTPQQGVDAGSGVTPAVQAGLDYQSQNNLQKLAASQPYDATTIGLEHQALGGNKDAQKDLAKYKTGVPLDAAKKVAYQANGLNILHNAAASAAENNQEDAATQFNSVSDNPDQRLENDNPQFFKDYHANLIANTRYNKDGNPFYSTLFSEPQISQQQLEQYGKENNLTPEQIAKLKPSDIPTGANWFEEAGQGAINAVPFLNTLAPETKKIFIGNTPTDQQSGKGVKGFLSHAMSGVGMVGSFMAQTALTGGLLKGAGILGDVGENAARYDTWATRIPLAMSNFNSSYEHAKEVVGDDPKDEGKRMLYAITNGTLSTALMSIDPYAKVGQEALAETKNGLADLLKNKDLADITKQEYQSAVERQAAKILEGSKVTAQHVGTQAGIMGANQIAQNLADKVFDPEHPHEVMDNVKDAAIGGAMALILPSIGAGYAAAKANTPLNVATMWEMGKNPEQYKSYIDDHLAKGTMTKEDAITSYQNLNKISQAVEATRNIETPSGEPLTPEQKARYAFSLFQEQKLNEKLESLQAGEKTTNLQPDKAQIDPINSQIKEQQAQRGDILTNAGAESEQEKPIPAGTQSDEDNTIKVKELVGRNILYKGEPATVSIDDGGEVTVTNKQTGKTHILGQSVKIGDDSAKNYDIEEPAVKGGPSVVSVNDAGNITVRGKEYKIPDEHTDNPIGAINYYNRPGEKGKPVSVTLLNDDGKQVTFRGDVGEDIMYHLHLKKLDKNNSRNDLMDFANNDAESKQKIHDNVGNSENNNIPLSGDNQSQQNLTENESIKGQNGGQNSTNESNEWQETTNAEKPANSEGRHGQEEDRVLETAASGEDKAGAAEKPQPANPVLSKADKIAALKKTKLKPAKKEQQIPIETEPALRPIDGGKTEGQPEAEAHKDLVQSAAEHPEKPSDYLFAGKKATGESPDNFAQRIGKGFDEIDNDAEKYPDNSVVVSHSTVLNTLKAAKELSPNEPHNFDHPDLWPTQDKQDTDPGRLTEYKTPDGRTIWLARHGETEDGDKELERTKHTPLTDGGREEAANIAKDLKEKGVTPSKIITSDLPRAKETGDIIQKQFANWEKPASKHEFNPPQPLKPLDEMTGDELSDYHDELKKYNKDLEKSILGDKYKEWGAAHRTSNSMFASDEARKKADKTIADIEGSLSRELQDKLYGIGEKKAEIADEEEVKLYRDKIQLIESAENEGELAKSISNSLIELNNTPSDPSKMTISQKVALAGMKSAKRIIEERGYNGRKVTQEALKYAASKFSDQNDAEFMLSKYLDFAQEQPKETPKPSGAIATEPAKEQKNSTLKPKPKEKTLTKEQQKVSGDAKLKYNMARKTPSKQGDMIRTATKRIEVLKERIDKFSKGSTPYKEAVNELAIKQDFINHTKQYPPKEVGKGYDVKDHMARVARVMKEAYNSESVEEDVMAAMLKMHDHHPETKWNASSLGNKAVFKANAKPSEITSARNYTSDEGKISIDKWAYGMSDDPEKQRVYKEEAERLIREHPSKVDLAKSLEKIQQDRIKAAEDPREAQMKEEWEQQQAREMDEGQIHAGVSDEEIANKDINEPVVADGQDDIQKIDEADLSDDDKQKIEGYYRKYYNEKTKEVNYDRAHMDYPALRSLKESLSDKGKALMDDIVPFDNFEQHNKQVQELIKNAAEYERQQREAGITEEGESEREITPEGRGAPPDVQDQATNEAPNPAGDSEAKLKEPAPGEVAAAEELSEAQRQHAEFDRQLKDKDLALQKERVLLQNHIAKGKEAEQKLKIALKGGDKDAIGNLTDEVNNRKKLADKRQDNIDRLERDRTAIARDQEIADNSNTVADKWQAQFEKNLKNHRGEALGSIAGLPKLSEKVQSFLVEHAIQAIRDLGNVRIAIRRAIRETKERWGKEAKDLSDEHINAIEDHFPEFNKRPKFEPKLPGDHEEFARNIIDLMRSGDISHEEAQQIVHEADLFNRDDEDYSDHVAENNKADILNYIDWHNDNDLTSIKNTTTRLRREQLGLNEEIPAAKKEFGTTWDEAKDEILNNPQKPQELLAELSKHPRPVTDVENAILLHHQNTTELKLLSINENINKAAEDGDQETVLENKVRKAAVLDELQKIYDVDKAIGTENARGLASRRMMTDRKYSLVNMVAEKRATANDGKPLNDEQQAEIESLHKKVQETQSAFDDYVKKAKQEIIETQRKLLEALQEKRDKNKSGTTDKNNTPDSKSDKIKQKSKRVADRLRAWADKIEKESKGQVNSSIIPITPKMIADGLRLVADGVEKGGDALATIGTVLSKISDKNPGINEQDLEKELNKAVINSGVLEPSPERRRVQNMGDLFIGDNLDPQAVRLKAAADRAKAAVDIDLKKDELKQLPATSKAYNLALKWHRAFLLSNPLTIAKLGAAGFTRMISGPLEDLVGGVYSKILPQLADGAIGEGGGLHINEYVNAYKSAFAKWGKDASDIMKHGKSDLDVVFGGKNSELPPEAADFFGQLHSATKAPFKRAKFEQSLEKRLRRNAANGVDITDPMVQTSIALDAYKDANRAIFMQDNVVAEGYQHFISWLENKDQKGIATSLQFLAPFVKIPTNIAAETGTHIYGAPVAAYKLLRAKFKDGIENLPEDQKDIIMRNLKKGTLGLAALSLGYFMPQSFGGFYQKNQKRKEGDTEPMGIKVNDQKLPGWAFEAPIFQAMQIGATVRKVKDMKVHGEENGIGEGIWAGALGLAQDVPLISDPIRLAQLISSPNDRKYYLGELAKSTVDPALLTYIAKVTDPTSGSLPGRLLAPENGRKSPKTIGEHIKSGLPFLREQLRPKHPKPAEEETTQFQ